MALTTVICIVSAFYVVKKFIKTDAESAAMGAKGTVTDKDGHRRSTRQAKTPQRFDPTKVRRRGFIRMSFDSYYANTGIS